MLAGLGLVALLLTGRVGTGPRRSFTVPPVPGPGPVLFRAERSGQVELPKRIRTGFTQNATRVLHALSTAFQEGSVEDFARHLDVDYEYDYHRMLHDLEAYFAQNDRISLGMELRSVEPLPSGFVAEVRWQKTFRIRKTHHQVHEEGEARLVFTGEASPRLRAVRGQMPF